LRNLLRHNIDKHIKSKSAKTQYRPRDETYSVIYLNCVQKTHSQLYCAVSHY